MFVLVILNVHIVLKCIHKPTSFLVWNHSHVIIHTIQLVNRRKSERKTTDFWNHWFFFHNFYHKLLCSHPREAYFQPLVSSTLNIMPAPLSYKHWFVKYWGAFSIRLAMSDSSSFSSVDCIAVTKGSTWVPPQSATDSTQTSWITKLPT